TQPGRTRPEPTVFDSERPQGRAKIHRDLHQDRFPGKRLSPGGPPGGPCGLPDRGRGTRKDHGTVREVRLYGTSHKGVFERKKQNMKTIRSFDAMKIVTGLNPIKGVFATLGGFLAKRVLSFIFLLVFFPSKAPLWGQGLPVYDNTNFISLAK